MSIRHHSARLALVISFSALPLALPACGAQDGRDENPSLGQVEENLYGKPSGGASYWNSGTGTPATIPVCWTYNAQLNKDTTGKALPAGHPGITKIRDWTRQAVEQSWARAANITFTGWYDTCTRSGKGDDADRDVNGGKIMFAFATTGDSTDILGKNPKFGTMIRISTATSWQPDYRTTAIHEMGHALGFAHEQDRPDNYSGATPLKCLNAQGAQAGGTYLNADSWGATRVDKLSTMCYDTELDLSRDDIMGVQRLYGRKPSGSVVGNYGECAGTLGPTAKSLLGSVSCQTATGTKWYYDRTLNGLDLIRSRSTTSLCWALNSTSAATTSVAADTCKSEGRFAFPSQNMRWRAIGNTCVGASSTSAGATLSVAGCGDAPNQRWDFFAPIGYTGGEQVGQIRLRGTSLCVTAPNVTPSLGDTLSLQTCIMSGDFTQQTFTLVKGTHSIRYSNLCANVFGGWPDTGAAVGLWNACDSQNSLFHMSGSLTSSGKCASFVGARGTGLSAGACKAAPGPDPRGLPVRDPQEWDIYW